MCCARIVSKRNVYINNPSLLRTFFISFSGTLIKMHRPKMHSKPSHIAKTYIENGIDRGCFYVVEIDDAIGKSLNTKFFKKQLKCINWNPNGSQKGPIK